MVTLNRSSFQEYKSAAEAARIFKGCMYLHYLNIDFLYQ